MWRGRRRGTEAGKPGDGGWGAGGGLSPAGMAGGALGSRGGGGSPRRPGAKPRPVFPSPKFLGFYPRELTRRGDRGPGRPRGMTMKRKRGARMEPGGPAPSLGLGEAVARGYSLPPVAVVLWWVVEWLPPNGCLCPVPWVQTPVGGGYEAPGRLAPPAQKPARRRLAFSASCRGGGGHSGQCGAPPLSWRPALPV